MRPQTWRSGYFTLLTLVLVTLAVTEPVLLKSVLRGASDTRAVSSSNDYVMNRFVVRSSWPALRHDAEALGLGRLYATYSNSPMKYGPRDGVWYVGTYRASCLISIGYPNIYSEYRLSRVPFLTVQVFNRYGKSTYLTTNHRMRYSTTKSFILKSHSHCG